VKCRYLISLLLPLILFTLSCTQQPEKKSLPERVAREKPASAKEKPLKIIHLAGETISVNPKTSKLTVRGKDGEVAIYATEKTVIHIGADKGRLSDISAGNKAIVKYLEIDGKYIARSIFIVQESREEKEPPKAEIPSPQTPEKSTSDQPPAAPSPKSLPPS
jgi:transposase